MPDIMAYDSGAYLPDKERVHMTRRIRNVNLSLPLGPFLFQYTTIAIHHHHYCHSPKNGQETSELASKGAGENWHCINGLNFFEQDKHMYKSSQITKSCFQGE